MSVGAVLARDTPGYSTNTMDIRQSSKSTGCTRTVRLVSVARPGSGESRSPNKRVKTWRHLGQSWKV